MNTPRRASPAHRSLINMIVYSNDLAANGAFDSDYPLREKEYETLDKDVAHCCNAELHNTAKQRHSGEPTTSARSYAQSCLSVHAIIPEEKVKSNNLGPSIICGHRKLWSWKHHRWPVAPDQS
ncbi:unnamed protein product [Pleuronectes platessa]|uniref:Uncharacterized protein n=1 Tax=Pleuronectes platessa TaxID=8262 RepID=A0A9N7THA6_PLEPL|nr:unnamed protein product [Pleuronectes platessa]